MHYFALLLTVALKCVETLLCFLYTICEFESDLELNKPLQVSSDTALLQFSAMFFIGLRAGVDGCQRPLIGVLIA